MPHTLWASPSLTCGKLFCNHVRSVCKAMPSPRLISQRSVADTTGVCTIRSVAHLSETDVTESHMPLQCPCQRTHSALLMHFTNFTCRSWHPVRVLVGHREPQGCTLTCLCTLCACHHTAIRHQPFPSSDVIGRVQEGGQTMVLQRLVCW